MEKIMVFQMIREKAGGSGLPQALQELPLKYRCPAIFDPARGSKKKKKNLPRQK
jgi:hypothetical protein